MYSISKTVKKLRMKTRSAVIPIITMLLFIAFSSCTMQKRLYRPGYYVALQDKQKKAAAKAKQPEQISSEEEATASLEDSPQLSTGAEDNTPAAVPLSVKDTVKTPKKLKSKKRAAVKKETITAENEEKSIEQIKDKTKLPLHPKIKRGLLVRGIVYAVFGIAAIILLVIPAVDLGTALLLFSIGFLFFIVYLFAIVLNCIGYAKAKKQEKPIYSGKGLALGIIIFDMLSASVSLIAGAGLIAGIVYILILVIIGFAIFGLVKLILWLARL